jgi:hypothetical protein
MECSCNKQRLLTNTKCTDQLKLLNWVRCGTCFISGPGYGGMSKHRVYALVSTCRNKSRAGRRNDGQFTRIIMSRFVTTLRQAARTFAGLCGGAGLLYALCDGRQLLHGGELLQLQVPRHQSLGGYGMGDGGLLARVYSTLHFAAFCFCLSANTKPNNSCT